MPYPTKYTRQFDFQSYQNANPTRPLPGDKVNADLNFVVIGIGEIVEFLKAGFRSDGQFANETIGLDQLKTEVRTELGGQGDPGDPGAAATIAVGTVSTVGPEDPATVTNVGTSAAAVFDFGIPSGADGAPGAGSGDYVAEDVVNAGAIPMFGTDPESQLKQATNSSVLAATTASFLTADETKLDNIEALADVTDATNVAAAGAVMNSLLTTRGDLIRRGASAPERVALGAQFSMLGSDGTDAIWRSAANAFADIKQAATTSATGVVELAIASEYRTGTDSTRALGVAEVWSAPALQTLTSTSNSVAVNFASFLNATLVLGENSTLANPSNEKVGQAGRIKVTATSSTRTLALHADYKPATGVESFPLSITTSETVFVDYWIQAANIVEITSVQRRAT